MPNNFLNNNSAVPRFTNSAVKPIVTTKTEWLTLATSVIASLALIGWVLWRCNFGLDLTDESFYLVYISNPWIYKVSASQFGYVYHPLYLLVSGDIALLRQANILITLGLAWGLCFMFLQIISDSKEPANFRTNLPRISVAFVLSVTTLMFCLIPDWLPTPSYNSLALQALLIAGTGMLLAEGNSSRSSLAGWVIIGMAGWLAFMAKPTTAAALGLAVGGYLILAGKLKLRMLAISLASFVAFGMLGAWFIDGSLTAFVVRVINGAENTKLLAGGHTLSGILRIDYFSLDSKEKLCLLAMTLIVFAATHLSLSSNKIKQIGANTIVLVFALGSLAIIAGLALPNPSPTNFRQLQILAAPLGMLLASMLAWHKAHYGKVSRKGIALAICFALFPLVLAFGTNRNYWNNGAYAAIFWVLSGITILASVITPITNWRSFLPAAVVAQTITVVLFYIGMEHPERQPLSLRQNQDIARIASTGSEVWVAPGFAHYIRTLNQLAEANGFKLGDAMIDLTGHYPGALYALGAKSIGAAWLAGGYKGSKDLASAALDRVPCSDFANAWILAEPSGQRALPPELLKRYGIDLAKDYVSVGQISSPIGEKPISYEQHLLKPTRTPDQALTACVQQRKNGHGNNR